MGDVQGNHFEPEFKRSIRVQGTDQRLTSNAGVVCQFASKTVPLIGGSLVLFDFTRFGRDRHQVKSCRIDLPALRTIIGRRVHASSDFSIIAARTGFN